MEVRVGEAVRAAITAEALSSDPEGTPIESLVREVRAPGEIVLDLRHGVAWRLRAEAPGFWSRGEIVVPGGEVSTVRLELVPTATVLGSVAVPRGDEVPGELGLRFEGPEGVAHPVPRETLDCPVEEGTWQCEVPARTLDLRIRARSYISHYLWEVELEPGEVRDLGPLELRKGASVVGRVEVADGGRHEERPRVTLDPRRGSLPGPLSDPRLDRLRIAARPDARGFFHFQGVPPGEYLLRAELDGFAPASHPVHVLEDAESTLEEPLVLRRPVPLEVFVEPSFDPQGAPWRVEAARLGETAGILEQVMDGPEPTESGFWQKEGLAPGTYLLRVLSSAGDAFAMARVELGPTTPPIQIQVPAVAVQGRLLLGDDPLAAVLSFGGKHGMVKIEMLSGEDGQFSGVLPRPGEWRVDVEGTEPQLFRRLPDVEIRGEPGGDPADLELRLPAGRIVGEVVTENGEPGAGAIVEVGSVTDRELPSDIQTGPGGRFELSGFGPGLYAVSAETAHAASDPILTRLEEDGEARVRLVLREEIELTGVVVSPSGGVPAARVLARPAVGAAFPVNLTSTLTDVDGRFSLRLPAWVRKVVLTVFAPGFSLKQVRAEAGREEPVTVSVTQHGGTLTLEWRGSRGAEEEPGIPPVVIGPEGIRQPLDTFHQWVTGIGLGRSTGRPVELGRLVVPRVEPGEYMLCWFADFQAQSLAAATGSWPPERCSLGTLIPYGELRLTVESPA